jgi:hypothetical protein
VRPQVKVNFALALLLCVSTLGCASDEHKITATLNQNASLVGDLPVNPLQWKVITSMVNKSDSSMSTLYGNDLAVRYARTNSQHAYPNSATLALVTWSQREDSRWYGARIPDRVKSVEFVFVSVPADGRASYSYEKYEGAPLKKVPATERADANERAAYLVTLRAAVMP